MKSDYRKGGLAPLLQELCCRCGWWRHRWWVYIVSKMSLFSTLCMFWQNVKHPHRFVMHTLLTGLSIPPNPPQRNSSQCKYKRWSTYLITHDPVKKNTFQSLPHEKRNTNKGSLSVCTDNGVLHNRSPAWMWMSKKKKKDRRVSIPLDGALTYIWDIRGNMMCSPDLRTF